jgi:outer membrane lipoprotein-sorting protein
MKNTRAQRILWVAGSLTVVAVIIGLLSAALRSPSKPPSTVPPTSSSRPTVPASGPQTSATSIATPSPTTQTPSTQQPEQVAEPQTATHSIGELSGSDDASLIQAQIDERARAIMLAAAHAQGGLGRLLAIHDWTMKAVATFYQAGQSLQVTATTYIKKPDKLRIEQLIAGRRITAASDGKTAWMEAAGQLLHLPQDRLDELKRQMSNDSGQAFTSLNDPAYHFKYLETKELDGRPADVIEISSADRPTMKLYFDDHTHKLVQEETQTEQGLITVRLSDFREISGITTPFRIETYLNGERLLLLTINVMAFDTGLKDELFIAPAQ